jgi:hypothetical protein
MGLWHDLWDYYGFGIILGIILGIIGIFWDYGYYGI